MKFKNYLLTGLFVLALALASCSQSADDIINKNIKARAGDAKVKITSIIAEQKAASFGFDVEMKVFIVPPEKMRVNMNLLGKEIITTTNGNQGWIKSDTIVQPLPPDQIEENKRVIANQLNYFQSEFVSNKENTAKTELMPEDTLFGKKVYRIKLTMKDSTQKIYYIDKENFLNLKTDDISVVNGVKNVAEFIFKDYKKIDGFMVPHTIDLIHNGSVAGKISIGKVEINKAIDPKLFELP